MHYKAKISRTVTPSSPSERYVLVTKVLATLILVMLFAQTEAFSLDGNPELSPTKYTKFSKNTTYGSSTEYNAMGMQPLYNITQQIMWFFVGEEPLPDGKSI